MEKNTKKLNFMAKLLGGTLFLGVFMFNIISFVNIDGGGISIKALKAYALSGGTGNEEEGGFTVRTESYVETQGVVVPGKTGCTHSRAVYNVYCDPGGTSQCTPSKSNDPYGETTCTD